MAHPKSTRKNSGIRYTDADGKLIARAATALGLSVNQFAVRTLVSAARIVLQEAGAARFTPGETAGHALASELSANNSR